MGRIITNAIRVVGLGFAIHPACRAQDSANAVATGDEVIALVVSPRDTAVRLTDLVSFRAVALSASGDTSALADIAFTPVSLFWQKDKFSYKFSETIMAPVGDYNVTTFR